MTTTDFLSRLDGVRQRGIRWSACCPAHTDNTPSLSISEGERGVLVKCWAGCSLQEICIVLGIEQRELFFDAHLPREPRRTQKTARIDRRTLAFRHELAAFDLRLRAERIVEAGKRLDVVSLSDYELDRALNAVAKAHFDVERAELFECVADDLRARGFIERKNGERQTRDA